APSVDIARAGTGQSAIADVFKTARPPIDAVGNAIGKVTKGISQIGADTGLTSLLNQVSPLVDAFNNVGDVAGSFNDIHDALKTLRGDGRSTNDQLGGLRRLFGDISNSTL